MSGGGWLAGLLKLRLTKPANGAGALAKLRLAECFSIIIVMNSTRDMQRCLTDSYQHSQQQLREGIYPPA